MVDVNHGLLDFEHKIILVARWLVLYAVQQNPYFVLKNEINDDK